MRCQPCHTMALRSASKRGTCEALSTWFLSYRLIPKPCIKTPYTKTQTVNKEGFSRACPTECGKRVHYHEGASRDTSPPHSAVSKRRRERADPD